MKERLREVDANLLLALHALLEERNLTHAGERMTMSQPAMSGALTRLRKHFDDELLVRVGRGFELSPLAERLKPAVEEAVEAAEALLGNQREFDPTSSNRLFTVSMSAYAMTVLAEPLTRLLAEQAPGCSVALESARRRARPVREPAAAPGPDPGAARLRVPRPPAAGLHRPPRVRRRPPTTPASPTARCRSTTCKRCRRPSPRSGPPASASARSRSRWSASASSVGRCSSRSRRC